MGGFRSLLAFWIGGASGGVIIEPPRFAAGRIASSTATLTDGTPSTSSYISVPGASSTITGNES